MPRWTRWLPFAFVEWFAKRHLERFGGFEDGSLYVAPWRNVWIWIEDDSE